MGFGEGVHDVGEDGGLGEGGVHGGEVIGGHALRGDFCCVAADVAGEVVDGLDDPEAANPCLPLSAFVHCLEGAADMVEELDQGLAQVVGGSPGRVTCGRSRA